MCDQKTSHIWQDNGCSDILHIKHLQLNCSKMLQNHFNYIYYICVIGNTADITYMYINTKPSHPLRCLYKCYES